MAEQFIPLAVVRKKETIDISSFTTEQARQIADYLNEQGLMNGAGTIQVDIAAATWKDPQDKTKGSDKSLCDTHCEAKKRIKKEGEKEEDEMEGFTCVARRFANLGISTKDLAPADKITKAFLIDSEGLKLFNQRFIENGSFDAYCDLFYIPSQIRKGIAYNLLHGKVVANVYGGNAEMHPDALNITRVCHEAGMIVNLTTTSNILLSNTARGKAFLQGLQEGFVDTLAVSADFKDGQQVREHAAMTQDELREARNNSDYTDGIKRKGYAAVNSGKLQNTIPKFPQLLFNLVVHSGNIDHIEEIIAEMKEVFPRALINPFPAQSSMYNETSTFSLKHIPTLQTFVRNRLVEQQLHDPHMILRPHYFAMLAAAFDVYKDDPETILKMFSGYDMWKCYENPYGISGAGRVVQTGASPEIRDLHVEPDAGGNSNCFWRDNTILRKGKKVWNMQPIEIAEYIGGGMQAIAKHAENPCPGCIMPRLTGDIVGQELGLNPALQIAYLRQRKQTVGF